MKTKTKMKPSEVLLKAAELVDEGELTFGCHAIFAAECINRSPLNYEQFCDESKAMQYLRLFKPRRLTNHSAYFGDNRELRVLALLFASAIAASEGN